MEPRSEGSEQGDTVALDAAWAQWLDDLSRLVKECLLPLFVLHCKRGQARLPLASIAASLDAAGRPLPGASSGAAVRRLADACPEWLAISEATSKEQAALVLLHAEGSTNTSSGHRPASCAGVVARGYSLALPATEGGERGGHDAQSKRWKAAQQSFYVDARTLEKDLSSIEACICARLRSLAVEGSRSGKEPAALAEGGASHGNTAATPEAQTQREVHDSSVLGFVEALKQSPDYHQQVCYVKLFPQRPAKFASFDSLVDSSGAELLSGDAHRALQQMSIDRLFEHQHTALQAVLGRRQHLCLTTGTSSGKSLAFALPILEAYRKDPNTKALILFPTKALAQDQLSKLQKLFQQVCPGLGVCTFDGDTPKDDRPRLLKSCHVFLTNPDMLHFTILASHTRWRHVLENLRFMVLDEAHVYRGSFGSHVALLLRRFRRVLKHYRASPIFIACSATMCRAGAFFSQLMALEDGEEVCVVDEDTAGRGERHFCLWNPPLLEVEEGQQSREQQNARKRARFSEKEGHGAAPRLPPGVGYRTRGSSYDEAAWIISQAARRGHRTVCFLQVRALVEIVLQATNKHLEDRPELQARIAGYRGGYAAVERRKLERRLFTGDLLCVIATNALELGIDIGDLDLTLHVGVPPTVASVWQQAGRAGRRGRPSTAILIAMDAPLEQHFCRHPDDFFARSIEARLPDTSNELLLKGHVLCAAAELSPLSEADARRWFGESIAGPLDELIREGRVVAQPVKPGSVSEAGTMLRITQGKNRKPPKEEVSLRDIDPVQFQVIVRGSANPLETLDQKFAYMRLHPGAIYLNQQTSYFVEELDLAKRIAWVIPRDSRKIDYYTECREHSTLVLAGGGLARASALPAGAPVQSASTPVVRSGRATVHWRMYGFRKKAKKDHSIIDAVDLTLPPVEYQTRATWMDLPGSVLQPLAQAGYSVDRGALHALEHAMIAMAPLCCDVEVMELSCQHTRRDSDPNRYFLLLYELQKGGSGASDKVYKGWEELLSQAVRLMKECPCESGCPNCIVISGCGDYNHGLEKAGALKIGAALGYGGDVATPSETAGPKDAADHAGAADSATSTMPQPKLPPRPKKTFAQCFNCGGGQAAQSVCMDLD